MPRQLAMSYRMIRVGFVFDLYLIHDKVPQKVSSFNKFSVLAAETWLYVEQGLAMAHYGCEDVHSS